MLFWFDEKNFQFTQKNRGSEFLVFLHCAVWKNEKFSLTIEIFRQINSLVIHLVKTLLSRNFCQNCVTVWKNEKVSLTKQIFRQINSLVI